MLSGAMTRTPLHKPLIAVLAISLIAAGMPLRARSQSVSVSRGARTSSAAALPSPRGASSLSSATLPPRDGAAEFLRFGALGFAAEPLVINEVRRSLKVVNVVLEPIPHVEIALPAPGSIERKDDPGVT